MFTLLPRSALPLLAACVLPAAWGFAAGTDASKDDKAARPIAQSILDDITPLDTLETQSAYVGAASFRQKEFRTPSPNAPNGRQSNYESIDELENTFEYGHRFHLFDRVYLKLGVDYERFDFGKTNAPLPTTLSALRGEINFEYIVKGNVAAFVNFNPGVYYANSKVSLGSVDLNTAVGSLFPVPFLKNVYGLFGLEFSILAHYPVQPFGGLVWLINDHLRLQAVPQEPRLIYTVNKQLDFFVGGEVSGTSFKRNSDDDARPQFKRFSKGVVDFSEERVGAGLTYTPIETVDIDLSGGWDIQRSFNYYRGDSKRFVTDGAPYVKLEVSANF